MTELEALPGKRRFIILGSMLSVVVLYRWMVEVPTDWWTVEETSATSVGTLDLDCRAKLFERPEEAWSKKNRPRDRTTKVPSG